MYNHSNSNINVNDTTGADHPDLKFNNVGDEVKAYPKHQGKHGLGRFGQDVEQLKMLGVIFGINALAKQFQPKPEEEILKWLKKFLKRCLMIQL